MEVLLSEIGNGVSISQLMIPEGQNRGGWFDFVHHVREMVGFSIDSEKEKRRIERTFVEVVTEGHG